MGERPADDVIDQRQNEEDLEGLGQELVVHLVRRKGQVRHIDDVAEGRVLDGGYEGRDQARDHVVERLRQDDVTHRAEIAVAERPRRIHLPRAQRYDAGAHDFAHESALIDDERGQHGDKARHVGAGPERNEKIAPENEHQQRHAAGEIDHGSDRPAQEPPFRQPCQRHQDADGKGERDAERRQDKRVGKPAERPVGILADEEQQPVILDDCDHVVDHARALRRGSARMEI